MRAVRDELAPAAFHPECRNFAIEGLRWLDDMRKYAPAMEQGLSPDRVRMTSFMTSQINRMKETNKVGPLTPGQALGGLNGFPRTENHKEPPRERPIMEPDTNAYLGKDTLQPMRMSTKAEVRKAGMRGQICIQFDFAAWYDQLPLGNEVRRLFAFFSNDGELLALNAPPMGLRQACEAAQGLTWLLLDFPHGDVAVSSCIDNVRFVGGLADVHRAARTFLKRCQLIDAQLNEVALYDEEGNPIDIDNIVLSKFEESAGPFLGEHYDYVEKTRKNTDKCLSKLRQTWTDRHAWSALGYASHMGVLFYTSNVAGIKPAKYYSALRYFRDVARIVEADPLAWKCSDISQLKPMPLSAYEELAAWTEAVMENAPVPMCDMEHEGPPDLTIITDASKWGWGAICVTADGAVSWCNQPWPSDQRDQYRSSVTAEPEGLWRAVCRFVRPSDKVVHLLTDHEPLVWAAPKGYAKGWPLNLFCRRIQDSYPGKLFMAFHVIGKGNPTDGISRGQTLSVEDGKTALDLAVEHGVKGSSKTSPTVSAHKQEWMV